MKFLLILLIALYSITSFAQAPGYLGKRFSAGYGFYASPGYVGSGGRTYLNMLHEGFLEYAISKTVSMGFSGRFYRSVYDNKRSLELTNSELILNGGGNQIEENPNGFTEIKGRNYMLYFKFFKNRYIAPWGRYFILGASLNTCTTIYDPDQMYLTLNHGYYPYSSYTYFSDFGPKKQSFINFDLMFGNGRSRIIANRIVLDYGYNINLIAMTTTVFDAFDDGVIGSGVLNTDNYFKKVSASRLRGVNRFNVFLKVGVLIF